MISYSIRILLMVVSCGAIAGTSTVTNTLTAKVPQFSVAATEAYSKLMKKAAQEGTVRVIVKLQSQLTPEGKLSESEALLQRRKLLGKQEGVLASMRKSRKLKEASVKKFHLTPAMAMEVSEDGLAELAANPEVADVVEDEVLYPQLYDTGTLIGATTAQSAGYTGSGQTIAILDSGVDKSHPFLMDASGVSRVVSEACYSTSGLVGGITYSSLCPDGVSSSTAAGSGASSIDTHGTHVAGIAAGQAGQSSSGVMSGVASSSNIISIQVASGYDSGGLKKFASLNSDIILGLERVYALRSTYNIAAVNMSMGRGKYTATCDTYTLKSTIDNLKSVGIATIIASGNDGYSDATSYPGCISTAITVGSTRKNDYLADYSNIASWVDLLAPGSDICSSTITGSGDTSCGSGYGVASGTSMAAPQVAGAWAMMKQKNSSATVDQILTALRSNAVAIDYRSDASGTSTTSLTIKKGRIDLTPALAALPAGGIDVAVGKVGDGTGTVTSTPEGINCGPSCLSMISAKFGKDSLVTVTAIPSSNSTLTKFSGCTKTEGATCTVVASAYKQVTATFTKKKPDFVVTSVVIPTSPSVKGTLSVFVTVKNQGLAAADSGSLTFWKDSATAKTCGAVGDFNYSFGKFEPGQVKTVNFSTPPPATTGSKTFRVFIDSKCIIRESNDTNNQFTTPYTVGP